MNKLYCVLFLLFSVLLTSFAQTNSCEDVKKENDYLRNALNINKPVMQAVAQNVEFSITKIEGNKTEQTVTITVLLNNKAANTYFQWYLSGLKAIDMEGNSYKLGTSFSREQLYTDVPYKAEIKLQKILPKVEMLRLFALSFYSVKQGEKAPELEFRDLPIEWN